MSNEQLGDQPYRIYSLMYHDEDVVDLETPFDVNFTTGLVSRLHKVNGIVTATNGLPGENGELVQRTHYVTATVSGTTVTYSDPVLMESWSYLRGNDDLVISRNHSVQWYYVDGTLDTEPDRTKVSPKIYDTIAAKRVELEKKRTNQLDTASEVAVMKQIFQGVDPTTAVVNGKAYWASLANEIILYKTGQVQPLIDRITNDSEPTWLAVNDTRTAMIAELS